jgi:hypothetical protein
MIWLTWRQYRLEALLAGGIFFCLAVFLLITGLAMANSYQHDGVAACVAGQDPHHICWQTIKTFRQTFSPIAQALTWINFLPLIVGVLLGAPFILEMENGTYRLAWTQSITRTRWLAQRLSLIVIGVLAASLLLTFLLTWWHGPFDALDGRFSPSSFDVEGTVTAGYLLFAVALVLAVGSLLRRTVPALGIALLAFLGARLGIEGLLRPWYVAPLTRILHPHFSPLVSSDWIVSDTWRNAHGQTVDFSAVMNQCALQGGVQKSQLFACLDRDRIVEVLQYQPADRFWTFQLIETGIFLGLSALLLGFTVWWVRKRVS